MQKADQVLIGKLDGASKITKRWKELINEGSV